MRCALRPPLLLCLGCCFWALGLALAMPPPPPHPSSSTGSSSRVPAGPGSGHRKPGRQEEGRCALEGFDAITPDDAGTLLFFQGDRVWKGFSGPPQAINASWPMIQGPIDAALRIHHPDQPSAHDNVYLFQGKHLWAFAQGKLKDGYPRLIAEEFPGVPGDLDAAVECPAPECGAATLHLFKDSAVYSYDLQAKQLKKRFWPSVVNCTAATRWLERYYCFQGNQFLRFDPVTGQVPAHYPRDARDYFIHCPGRGHGHHVHGNATLLAIADRCSGHPFQAFTSDDTGRIYAFRGGHYFRVDSARDGWHFWPLNHLWKELEGDVDAAFSWEDKLYLVQGSQVSLYRSGQGYNLVDGYPQPLQEELGVASVEAAFTCPHSQALYVIQGNQLQRVDLKLSPGMPGPPHTIPHAQVDSALCTTKGVYLFHGPNFHHYTDADQLIAATAPSPPQSIALAFFHCPPRAAGHGGPPPHVYQ